MKYDFSTYILNKLNEADEPQKSKKPYSTADEIKTKLNNFILDKGVIKYKDKTGKPSDKVSVDTLKEIKNGEGWNDYYKNNKSNDMIKAIIKTTTEQENKSNTIRALDKDGFELLGKTIAYRSALTVWNIVNNSGDDFKQATLDVFKDNSEYSLKQLENLDSLLDYSAAIGVVKDKKNRLDKNDANYESLLKKCNDAEAKLTSKENYTTIQQIKKDYEKEFKDKRDVYEKSFNDGMAEQKKDMQAKDYKWKDPATGQPPKGKLAKSNQAADAIFKSIQSGVDKAGEFAKRQQGLDKAILSLAVIGVKGIMFGGKMLKKLLTGFLKKTNLKDLLRYTAKFNDVKDKINVFKKEYDEWKKYNDAQQQKKEKTDDEKKEEEDRKKTISAKLTELMNTHVIPYYYCKMAIVIACFENLEGKYIIKQENNKWSTYNSGSGRLTIIEDNAILMERILEVVNNQLVKGGVFETLKDESSADAFKAVPKALKYNKQYADNLLKWKDKIKSVSTVSKFNKDNLKNILNVYNEKVIVNNFASYTEFAEYVPIAQGLVKQHDIPVAKEIVIKFDGDEDAGIPGIVTGAKKEDNQEEEKAPVTEEVAKEALNNVTYKDGNVYIKYSEYNGTKDFNVSFNKENAEKKEHLEGFTDVYSKYKDVFDEWANQNKDNKDLQEPINIMKIALGYNEEKEEKEKPEELPKEIEQQEEQQYSKIMDELSTLSKVNDTENLVQNFDKTNNDINKAYELMKNNISKLDNEGAKKLLGNLEMDNADMLKKLMYLNTAKSSGVFKESTILGEALLLLEGANADELFSKVYSFLKKDNLTEDDVRKFNHYYGQFVQKLSNILKSGNIKDNELKELLTQHKDPLERYYILKIWKKEKENKPEEKKEGEQPNGDNKPDQENGENKQET